MIAEMTRPTEDPLSDAPALRAIRLLLFTGLAVAATAMGFVFLPLAGLVLAALVAWTGYARLLNPGVAPGLRTLAILAFGGYAIAATAMAFAFLPWGGALLAAMFLWRGADAFGSGHDPAEIGPRIAEEARPRSTAFDAYRAETLRRLEEEQGRFDDFLGRLRAAKDKSEFDAFMDDRARRATTRDDA